MAEQHPCPNCGEAVPISTLPVHAKAAGEPGLEQAKCPTCGEQLQRDALVRGAGWVLVAS